MTNQEKFDEAFDKFINLEEAAHEDFMGILSVYENEPSSYPIRCALIRSLFAYIEAYVNGLTQVCAVANEIAPEEFEFKSNDNDCARGRIKLILKKYFSLICIDQNKKLNFGDHGWDSVIKSIELRNRSVHPKEPDHFRPTDDQMELIEKALIWFVKTKNYLNSCALDRVSAASPQGNEP